MWCSPDVADGWYYQGPNKRGAQYTFSDVAIQTVLTLGMIYHLPLRQAEGFTDSVLVLMGLALRVPDYSTLSRRQADQAVSLSPPPRGPIHLVVDATGLKVYGEGAWKVRQHGVSQRRTWRKLHLGVDEATGQIVAQTLTTAGVDDGSQVEPLLAQVQAPLEAIGGDGAYDQARSSMRWPHPSPRSNRLFRRVSMPKSNNMATQKPSRCPAMRPFEPSAKRADKRGKKPAAIIDDLSSKPTSDAIKRSSATPCAPVPSLTNKPKPGSAVPCSTRCYNSLNPNRTP